MRNKPMGATIYGIDLGKNTFHIVGIDSAGRPMQRITLSRATIFNFFSNASRALIGMEACPGSQWLARKLETLGHIFFQSCMTTMTKGCRPACSLATI